MLLAVPIIFQKYYLGQMGFVSYFILHFTLLILYYYHTNG